MRGILTDYRCRYQVISKWRDTFGIGKQYKGDDIVATSVERIENRKYRKCDNMLEYEYKQKNGNVIYVKCGQCFERLTIQTMYKDKGRVYSDCTCKCGTQVQHVLLGSLIRGNTKSCGCLNQELKMARNLKHGCACRAKKSRLYKIWADMHKRCDNPNTKSAKHYYEKKIAYCDEWKSFQAFQEWALSHGYRDDLTLERKDNTKGYCPENCLWIPFSEQSKNRTSNHYITYQNETHTLTEWSRILGLKRSIIYSRLRRNLPIEDVLSV